MTQIFKIYSEYEKITNTHTINEGKTIKELLCYDDVCYWWFIDVFLLLYLSKPENKEISYISTLLDLFKYLPIPLITICVTFLSFFWKIHLFDYYSLRNQKKLKTSILYRELFTEIRYAATGAPKNIYHQDIMDILRNTTGVTEFFNFGVGFSSSRKLRRHLCASTYLVNSPTYVEKHLSFNVFKKTLKSEFHFKKSVEHINKNETFFNELAQISGKNEKSIRRYLTFLVLAVLPYSVWYIGLCENMINIYSPSVLVMRDEQTLSGRGLIYAAKKHQVCTIGIQHGVLENHEAYLVHNSNDILHGLDYNICAFPIPDITCVWGESDKKLLIGVAGYPANSIVLTGNPRYDYISDAYCKYSRSAFCETYGISERDTIITWTTQSHGFSISENIQYLEEVFSTLSTIENVTLIIKQHPYEKDIHTNLINDYVERYGGMMSVVFPDKMENTTEMVYISDIVINCFSTTGQEAVAFHKPMIILDFSKVKDRVDFVKEGVGIPVYHPGSLRKVIMHIIDEGCDMVKAQDTYISNHMYKLDGHSSQRIADVVIQNIKK